MDKFFSSTRWKDIRETLDGGSYVWRMVGEEETADLRPEVLFPALAAKVLAKMLRSNLAWGSLNSLLPGPDCMLKELLNSLM